VDGTSVCGVGGVGGHVQIRQGRGQIPEARAVVMGEAAQVHVFNAPSWFREERISSYAIEKKCEKKDAGKSQAMRIRQKFPRIAQNVYDDVDGRTRTSDQY